jgi:hypothetical protein
MIGLGGWLAMAVQPKSRRAVMLRYVYFGTNNLEKAIAFYEAALAPLGMERCVTNDPDWDRIAAGWGTYEDGGARELGFWVGKPQEQ